MHRVMCLTRCVAERLGEPSDHLRVDRIVLGKPPGRQREAAHPLGVDNPNPRMHASTLSLATSMPTTTRSFCTIIHSLPCSVRAQRPLQLFGLRKTPELSLALTQAHRPLGATGSAPATGGSDPTARSHILTDLPDTRGAGMEERSSATIKQQAPFRCRVTRPEWRLKANENRSTHD